MSAGFALLRLQHFRTYSAMLLHERKLAFPEVEGISGHFHLKTGSLDIRQYIIPSANTFEKISKIGHRLCPVILVRDFLRYTSQPFGFSGSFGKFDLLLFVDVIL